MKRYTSRDPDLMHGESFLVQHGSYIINHDDLITRGSCFHGFVNAAIGYMLFRTKML